MACSTCQNTTKKLKHQYAANLTDWQWHYEDQLRIQLYKKIMPQCIKNKQTLLSFFGISARV